MRMENDRWMRKEKDEWMRKETEGRMGGRGDRKILKMNDQGTDDI